MLTQDTILYDEVDEQVYTESARRKILANDHFVVDDDGRGYADYGQNEWEQEQDESDAEIDEEKGRKRKKKSIAALYSKVVKQPKEAVEQEVVVGVGDADLLDSILGDVDRETEKQVEMINAAKCAGGVTESVFGGVKAIKQEFQPVDNSLSFEEQYRSEDDFTNEAIGINQSKGNEIKTEQIKFEADQSKIKKEDEMDIDAPYIEEQIKTLNTQQKQDLPISSSKPTVQPKFIIPLTPSEINESKINCMQSDGSVNLFWIDAYESNASVYLFGKVCLR